MKLWVVVGAVFVLALAMRIPGPSTTLTADEDRWILRSSWFLNEVARGGFKNTFMTTHPATTLMWLSGTGIFLQSTIHGLPIEIGPEQIPEYMMVAKIPVVLATSLLIAYIAYSTAYAFNTKVAAWSGILLAVDPFITGLSQIVHLDALLSLFLAASFVSLLAYHKTKKIHFLLLSALLQGGALATKLLPALWGVAAGGMLLMRNIKMGIVWALLAALSFWILCPALWTFDSGVGNENYTSGLASSYKDDLISIATDDHIDFAHSQQPIDPRSFYLRTLAARTSPIVLVAALTTIFWSIKKRSYQEMLPYMLYAAGFMTLITCIAKKGDRYALPALVMLCLLAAIGISKIKVRPVYVFLACIAFLQTISWMPHALAYDNGIFPIRHITQQGWGEGLEEAAQYLNKHPLAGRGKNFTVASWYPRVFAPFFTGTTLSLSSRDDDRVAFLVIYRNMAGRGNESDATTVLEELANKTPEHTVFIHGVPYAWIYNTMDLRYFNRNTGELLQGEEVAQTIPSAPANWNSIEIGLSTYSGRKNTNDIVLHIKESQNAAQDIRTVMVPAKTIEDRSYHLFSFDTIPDSEGKSYVISLTSPNASSGNTITIQYMAEDTLPGNMVWKNQSGDIAYRTP